MPTNEDNVMRDFNLIFNNAKRNLKQLILKSDLFDKDNLISDYDINTNNLSYNRKSFVTFEFFMKQKNDKKLLSFENIKKEIIEIFINVEDNIAWQLNEGSFLVSYSKQRT